MFKIFQEFLANPWYAAILVFFTQILMLYFRTINIYYTTHQNIFGSIWSNNANAIAWLLSITIGMNSMINGQIIPIIAYLVGGSLGTYFGIKQEQKQHGIKKDTKG